MENGCYNLLLSVSEMFHNCGFNWWFRNQPKSAWGQSDMLDLKSINKHLYIPTFVYEIQKVCNHLFKTRGMPSICEHARSRSANFHLATSSEPFVRHSRRQTFSVYCSAIWLKICTQSYDKSIFTPSCSVKNFQVIGYLDDLLLKESSPIFPLRGVLEPQSRQCLSKDKKTNWSLTDLMLRP